ncbi:MAG: hypothetical protein ACQEXJ_05605 [Myxococcota bacterium]
MGPSTPRTAARLRLLLLLVVLALLGGCREESALLASADASRPSPGPGERRQPAATPEPRGTDASREEARLARCFGDLLDEYEALRENLAESDLAGAKRASSRLASSAKTMADACGGPMKSTLDRLARDGTAFGAAPNPARAREVFGAISRGVLTVAEMRPHLVEGLRAYRCPLIEGYDRWLQRGGEPSNPYLAPTGPACAEPVEVAP